MTRIARLFPLAVALLLVPVSVRAQDVTRAAPAPAAAGPTLESTSIAARATVEQTQAGIAGMALQRRANPGRPVALMIVGGAAIVLGSIIGDAPGTLFMIGGAVALLYGLYLWLQ